MDGKKQSNPGAETREAPKREKIRLNGRMLAAPSWVIPGTLADNCRFLSGKVDEVGLLFFEQDACLAYGKGDLPLSLADLGLSYHVHLPADLDWSRPALAAENCLRLMDKVDFLKARLAVLHPPTMAPTAVVESSFASADSATSLTTASTPDCLQALEVFINAWQKAGRAASDIALENTQGCDLLAHTKLIIDSGMNICLDIGHIFAYAQQDLSVSHELIARARLFHLSAPGTGKNKSRHLPLSRLVADEQKLVLRLIGMAPPDAAMMPELFNWADYTASASLLAKWLCTN